MKSSGVWEGLYKRLLSEGCGDRRGLLVCLSWLQVSW